MVKSDENRSILIIEHDRELGEMFATVVAAEGYRAEWRPNHPGIVAEVRELQPDLLIVGMRPTAGSTAFDLLDLLRSDELLRRIPVLAVTASDQLAERAPASFNVRATLIMPFDLDELVLKTAEALSQPTFHRQMHPAPPPAGIFGQAEAILTARSRDTLFRWVQRLRTETALRERDDLRYSEMLDSVPVLIEVLSAVFRYDSPMHMLRQNPQVADRVCLHATTRRDQGVSLELLVQEYTLLREEVWRTFWRGLPEQLARDDISKLHTFVDGTLDLIIQRTIPSYLEGRADSRAE